MTWYTFYIMKNEQASNQLIITLIINVAEKCLKLKESIRMMKSPRLDIERNKVIEDGKRMGNDEIIK